MRRALPTTAHPSSGMQRRNPRLPGSQGAPCVDTRNFSSRSAPPGSYLCSFPAGELAGRPPLPRSAEVAVTSRPEKVAVPSARGTRGDLRAVQQLADFLSSLLQKLQRKLSTPLARLRLRLRQQPPAGRPQLLPRHPAFVLLPHPALEPGGNSPIPVRGWGLRAPGPSQGRAGAALGCLHAVGLHRRLRSPARPGRRRAPVSVRVPLRLAASRPPGAFLLPSLGELGAGPRACAAGPHTPWGGGLGIRVFLSPALARLPARPPHSPGWKASCHLRGGAGTARHLRAPRMKRAGRMPPQSSVSRVRCSSGPSDGSTCFFFFLPFFFLPPF